MQHKQHFGNRSFVWGEQSADQKTKGVVGVASGGKRGDSGTLIQMAACCECACACVCMCICVCLCFILSLPTPPSKPKTPIKKDESLDTDKEANRVTDAVTEPIVYTMMAIN